MNYYKLRRRQGNKLTEWFRNRTIVGWLIIINVVAFIAELIAYFISEKSFEYIALKPETILQGQNLWTLLTHMFVHDPTPSNLFMHLIINMIVLYSLGNLCEKIIGKKRFFWFYILSGLFAGILSVVLAGFFGTTAIGARIFGSPDIFMVGASGAIFAIAGLYVILLPRLKFMIIFLPFFSLPAYVMIPLVLFGVWLITIATGAPIGNVAHFGGFLAGIIYGIYLRKKYKRKIIALQRMFR